MCLKRRVQRLTCESEVKLCLNNEAWSQPLIFRVCYSQVQVQSVLMLFNVLIPALPESEGLYRGDCGYRELSQQTEANTIRFICSLSLKMEFIAKNSPEIMVAPTMIITLHDHTVDVMDSSEFTFIQRFCIQWCACFFAPVFSQSQFILGKVVISASRTNNSSSQVFCCCTLIQINSNSRTSTSGSLQI